MQQKGEPASDQGEPASGASQALPLRTRRRFADAELSFGRVLGVGAFLVEQSTLPFREGRRLDTSQNLMCAGASARGVVTSGGAIIAGCAILY